MAQKKLIRFAEIKTFPNVLEQPKDIAGKWHTYFKNNHPITLELACGKGEYTVGLAQQYPNRNFIGVDIKGNRIWKGAKTCLTAGIQNAAFLRARIEQITDYFKPGEVSEIWIIFPDPQLRLSKAKKRLTHPRFLNQYFKLLQPGGKIHLKTDSPALYQFTKTVINLCELKLLIDLDDVYSTENISNELKIKTYYESLDIAKSNKIHYLQFVIPQAIPTEKEAILKALIHEQS